MGNYYIASDDLENKYALQRNNLPSSTCSSGFGSYKDGETDLAWKFVSPYAQDQLYDICKNHFNVYSYSPLRLVDKGCAPHIETDLTRNDAKTCVIQHGSGNGACLYTIVRDTNAFYIYKYDPTSVGFANLFNDFRGFDEDLYLGNKGAKHDLPSTLYATITMPEGVTSPYKVFFQLCAGGGGGGGSTHNHDSGGGSSGCSVCGILDFSNFSSISIILTHAGAGGSGGRDTSSYPTSDGGDAGYASIFIRGRTIKSAIGVSNPDPDHYYYKIFTVDGGKGGKRATSSANGAAGSAANSTWYTTYGKATYNGDRMLLKYYDASIESFNGSYLTSTDYFPDVSAAQELFTDTSLFVMDFRYGTDGSNLADSSSLSSVKPLTANFTSTLSLAAASSNFTSGQAYGGGASGLGNGSAHGGQDPGPGGGGNGRAAYDPPFYENDGKDGYPGGPAYCKLFFY